MMSVVFVVVIVNQSMRSTAAVVGLMTMPHSS